MQILHEESVCKEQMPPDQQIREVLEQFCADCRINPDGLTLKTNGTRPKSFFNIIGIKFQTPRPRDVSRIPVLVGCKKGVAAAHMSYTKFGHTTAISTPELLEIILRTNVNRRVYTFTEPEPAVQPQTPEPDAVIRPEPTPHPVVEEKHEVEFPHQMSLRDQLAALKAKVSKRTSLEALITRTEQDIAERKDRGEVLDKENERLLARLALLGEEIQKVRQRMDEISEYSKVTAEIEASFSGYMREYNSPELVDAAVELRELKELITC